MPSPTRAAIDRLLAMYPEHELTSVYDPSIRVRQRSQVVLDATSAALLSPWLIVVLANVNVFAIWRRTGDVYKVEDGEVGNSPMLTLGQPQQAVGS